MNKYGNRLCNAKVLLLLTHMSMTSTCARRAEFNIDAGDDRLPERQALLSDSHMTRSYSEGRGDDVTIPRDSDPDDS